MSIRPKTQRAFLGVTAVTVVAVTMVFLVYAIVLTTINGGNVSVVNTTGNVWYSKFNSTSTSNWTSTLSNVGISIPWYSKLNMSSGGPSGAVTVTWILQAQSTGWGNVTGGIQTTSITLTGNAQTIYATSDGTQTLNKNWGALCTSVDTYRIRVVITEP